MGLLSRIESIAQHKTGLLARAEHFESEKVFFYDWIISQNITQCGIFASQDNFFYLKKSFGLDLGTISNSISTEAFWDGIIKDNNWNYFNGESLTPLFQLFSDKQKDNINSISILPFCENNKKYFLLIINGENKDFDSKIEQYRSNLINLIKNPSFNFSIQEEILENGFEISKANLFILSLKLCFEDSFAQLDSKFANLLAETSMDEIYFRMSKLFSKPNYSSLGQNNEIKFVMFSKDDIDDKLIQFHINNSLKSFFMQDTSSKILVLPAGICPNKKGTVDFLLKG